MGDRCVMKFSVRRNSIASCLKHFEELDVKICHIESRTSQSNPEELEIYIDCFCRQEAKEILCQRLQPSFLEAPEAQVPFPRTIWDLDERANCVQNAGVELIEEDHPGFNDPVYRKRRKEIDTLARNYKHGQQIPRVQYTKEEIETWSKIFCELTKLHPTHACKEFNEAFPQLIKHCGYREDNIPQLEDISNYLKKRTGFQLRPVAGLLSPRDFLAGLAFRVFHSTQYLRHSSRPDYTPEPDVAHELLGHVPLFCNPEFADFSQALGLASLGAPDDYVQKLATLYWFTVEFGLCKQDGKVKAYGAGILSSFGELQYCLTDGPEVEPFDPSVAAVTDYPITRLQPKYFLAENFADARDKLMEWSKSIPKPFALHYNAYTESVEVLDKNNKQLLQKMLDNIKSEAGILQEAIEKL